MAQNMVNKHLWVTKEYVIIIILMVLLVGSLGFLLVKSIIKNEKILGLESECLREIALDYCKERGWTSLGVAGSKHSFKCAITERTFWNDAYSYKFLEEERDECKESAKISYLESRWKK